MDVGAPDWSLCDASGFALGKNLGSDFHTQEP